MNFFAIRYFVVQSTYTLFPLPEDLKPKDLFIQPLINQYDAKYYNKTYTSRFITADKNERYLVGYLLKSTDTHLIQLNNDLFQEQDIQNWEKVFFIIDTEKQILLVEYNTQVATPENVRNVLLLITKKVAFDNGYEIKMDFLVDKFAFWQIIEDSSGLYQIAFNLNSPNLFGGTKKANEWLQTLKQDHNMTSVAVDFRNENAELRYDKEELESYRDYADSGGGSWTLGVFQHGRKKKFHSVNHLRKKETEFTADDPNYIRENLEAVRAKLVDLINTIDDAQV